MIEISPLKDSVYRGAVSIPCSKSICARVLMMAGVGGADMSLDAGCDDVEVMQYGVKNVLGQMEGGGSDDEIIIDVRRSGTALRFLAALCATCPGRYLLTGDSRLCERPVGGLVDALKSLGADMEYRGHGGCAPLFIRGKRLKGGRVIVPADVSSQYISALMLIGADMECGLTIEMTGRSVSGSYIELTGRLMNRCGVAVVRDGDVLQIPHGVYDLDEAAVLLCDKDWSAAAVWFAAVALGASDRLLVKGLDFNSLQPDRRVPEIFGRLGVAARHTSDGVEITATGWHTGFLRLDCLDNPDIIMTVAVTAAMLGVPFEITGVTTLKNKESDRVAALQTELRRCGFVIEFDGDDTIRWAGERCESDAIPEFETYGDHRMAMSMALVGLNSRIRINDEGVTSKSYKDFWREFGKIAAIERTYL